MGKYRKVDPRIWNDKKFMSMTDNGKLAFLFVMTHPHMTALGAMRGSVPGMASELNWKTEAFAEAFQEAIEKGMVNHDHGASFVWLPNFLKYNSPESPNVVKSWDKSLDLLPECDLFYMLLEYVKEFVKGLNESYQKALPKAFRKAMPNQEQEQEQEQEKSNNAFSEEKAAEPPPSPQSSEKPKSENKHFSNKVGQYSEHIVSACRSVSQVVDKKKFNPFSFVQGCANKGKHPGAILKALQSLNGAIRSRKPVSNPYKYVEKIVDVESGNYCETDHIQQAAEFKEAFLMPEMLKLFTAKGVYEAR